MMRIRVGGIVVLAMALSMGAAVGAAGQSITSIRGLGYPMVATDARSEALGGLGIGLIGLSVPMINPASAAGVQRRGVVVSAAATERASSLGAGTGRTGTTRFPLIRVLVPVGDVVLSGGYGTYLDQSWAVVRDGSASLAGSDVDYRDVMESTGGVGQARIGAAVPLGEQLAVGVSVGTYSGRRDLTLQRRYDTTFVGSLEPYRETRAVHYGGASVQAGFRWELADALQLAGSVTWSDALTADSAEGAVTSRSYALPLQVAGGASAYLAPGLLAAVSGRWSGWSVTDPSGGLAEPDVTVTARDTWELGGGLELDNPEPRGRRSYPVRVGFQYRQLPFTFVSDSPDEWVASVGTGIRFGADFQNPLARLDLTVQRGARTATGNETTADLEESFWRFAIGLSIFGN